MKFLKELYNHLFHPINWEKYWEKLIDDCFEKLYEMFDKK